MTVATEETRTSGRWFTVLSGAAPAQVRLYAFPHAGGSAASFAAWRKLLPPHVELRVLQLPGRQERRREAPLTRMSDAVDAVLEPFCAEPGDLPTILYGHSYGAVIAYLLTVELERAGRRAPDLLALSGAAPGERTSGSEEMLALSELPEDRFRATVAERGILPPEVCASDRMFGMVSPSLRADLSAVASFVDDHAVVDRPVVTYCGTDDPLVTPRAMSAWSARTRGAHHGPVAFSGGHFFLWQHAKEVAEHMLALL